MEAKVIGENLKNEWDQFVADCEFGDVLQSWEWGEVKSSGVWKPIRVAVFEQEKIIGVVQILRRKLFGPFSLLYCPRGPVIDWESENAVKILTLMIRFIRRKLLVTTYRLPVTLFLRIEPPVPLGRIKNLEFQPEPAKGGLSLAQAGPPLEERIKNLGFCPYFKSIQPRHTAIVDLSRNKEEILMSFEKDTRYSIKRAEREKVAIKRSSDQAGKKECFNDLKIFYGLYLKTSKRGNFAPRPWSQFEKIGRLMMPKDLARLYLAFFENELLAGALILKLGKKAYYLWGASARSQPKKFAAYLLQWEIMKDLKNSGIFIYDFWGIAPSDNKKHLWHGHTLFKKGFLGKRIDFIGSLDFPLTPLYFVYYFLDYIRQRFVRPDLLS